MANILQMQTNRWKHYFDWTCRQQKTWKREIGQNKKTIFQKEIASFASNGLVTLLPNIRISGHAAHSKQSQPPFLGLDTESLLLNAVARLSLHPELASKS